MVKQGLLVQFNGIWHVLEDLKDKCRLATKGNGFWHLYTLNVKTLKDHVALNPYARVNSDFDMWHN